MHESDYVQRKRLERLVEELNRNVDAVVVEGYCDRRVIHKLGFNGKLYESAQRTLEELKEEVSRGAERVAILTDFDEHGRIQNQKILKCLEEDLKVFKCLRRDIRKELANQGRMTIEEAAPLLESKEEKFTEATLDRLYPSQKSFRED